jgi:4'-phosphopantetheinyl transferase EntD
MTQYSLDNIEKAFESIFPPQICCAMADRATFFPLLDQELALVQASRSNIRKESFRAGRQAAHKALLKLKGNASEVDSDSPILSDRYGAPIFPSGVTGSISHSGGLSLAAVALESRVTRLGVDIQIIREIDHDALAARIAVGGEKNWIESGTSDTERLTRTLTIFSAKESIYKACNTFAAETLTFHSVELKPLGPSPEHMELKVTFIKPEAVPGITLKLVSIGSARFVGSATWSAAD